MKADKEVVKVMDLLDKTDHPEAHMFRAVYCGLVSHLFFTEYVKGNKKDEAPKCSTT